MVCLGGIKALINSNSSIACFHVLCNSFIPRNIATTSRHYKRLSHQHIATQCMNIQIFPEVGHRLHCSRFSTTSTSTADSLSIKTAKSSQVAPLEKQDEVALGENAAAFSKEVLQDPISYITQDESEKLLVPYPQCDNTYLVELMLKPFRDHYMYDPAATMMYMCVERLENDALTQTFGVDEGFNHRAYLLALHLWVLHRRAMKELPRGYLLDEHLFRIFYKILQKWLQRRGVPEYRFKWEFQNTRDFMMRFLVLLDQATFDEDNYPYKIAQVIKTEMYENEIDDDTLKLIVKYIIRQFVHVSNLGSKEFLDAMFLWADVEDICPPRRLLTRASPKLIKYDGYSVDANLNKDIHKLANSNTKSINA